MKKLMFAGFGILALASVVTAQWVKQEVGTDASFRGLSVVSAKIVWISGTKGTYGRTVDGGAHWQMGTVPGAGELDFRDVEAFDAKTAYLMAAGPGEASRIYKTTDGGANWTLQFKNTEPKAFFDSIAFWDVNHGLALSDPVGGRFLLLRTENGGKTWQQLPDIQRPKADEGEAAFAASGTCLVAKGKSEVWIATGGNSARIFHSADRGLTWKVSESYIKNGAASAGVFSIAIAEDRKRGVAVGGDYQIPDRADGNFAWTEDGGIKWNALKIGAARMNGGPEVEVKTGRPPGFRSGVAYVPGTGGRIWVTVGTNGSDISKDGGESWKPLDMGDYNSVAFADSTNGWAVGAKGVVVKFTGISETKR